MAEEKENKESKDVWFIGELTTQTEPIILNRNNEEIRLDGLTALVLILNKLEALEKVFK